MTAIPHFVAITCYVGAAALAATPFARPVGAPVRGVVALLGAGVLAHLAGLIVYAREGGRRLVRASAGVDRRRARGRPAAADGSRTVALLRRPRPRRDPGHRGA